jgi:hypothetical protein
LTGLSLGGTAAFRTVFCSVARFTTVEAQAGTGTRGLLHSGGAAGQCTNFNLVCPSLNPPTETKSRRRVSCFPGMWRIEQSNKRHRGSDRAGEETRDPWRRLLYRETASIHHGKLYWKYCVATPTDILSRCRHVGCVVICSPDDLRQHQHLGQRIEHMGRTLRIIHLVGAELHGLLPGAQVQKSLRRQMQK